MTKAIETNPDSEAKTKQGPVPATQEPAPYCWQRQDYGGLLTRSKSA